MPCKLACYGVLADELEWFDQYLAGRKQMVCMGEAQSICGDILEGIRRDQYWVPCFLHCT